MNNEDMESLEQFVNDRGIKLIAQYKQKEFDRLKDYVLNLISEVEVGLNITSIGRNPYGDPDLKFSADVWVPSEKEIDKLHLTLHELRSNILTSEELEALNEKG